MDRNTEIDRREILRRSATLGFASAGLLSGAVLCPAHALAADEMPTVNILNSSGTLTLVSEQLFIDNDDFAAFGIKANFINISDGSKILAGLVSGSGDMCGGAGLPGVFVAIEKGARMKVLGGLTMRPQTVAYSKRPEIKTAKDLVGRTFASGAPGSLLYTLCVAFMLKSGVDYKSVNFVNVGAAPDVFKAVAAGTVDAGIAEVDYMSQQDKYGVHALDDGLLWDTLPDFVSATFYAMDDVIKTKRDLLVSALAAHARMMRFVAGPNSEKAFAEARRKALGNDSPEDAETQWKFFQVPGRLGTDLVIPERSMTYLQKLNVQLGVQKSVLPYDQVADMSLAQDALKLL